MANVKPHPYAGSDQYCERCNLPQENSRHETGGYVLLTVGQVSYEWFLDGDDTRSVYLKLIEAAGAPTILGKE